MVDSGERLLPFSLRERAMTNPEVKDDASGIVQIGQSGIHTLTVTEPEGVEIIARLRETHGDVRGRAFLINLDQIIVRLGPRWEAKEDMVRQLLAANFAQRFQEPNWCAQILDNAWLAVAVTATARAGALKCAEIWYETGQFFVGDVSDAKLPLYEVLVEDAAHLKLRPIDLATYFDRGDDFGAASAVRPQIAPVEDATSARENLAVGTMTAIQRPTPASAPVVIGGRTLHVACAVEPVFELKNLSMIGHRLEPVVIDRTGNVHLDSKAMKGMDWTDREKVDIANIEEGLRLLRVRSPGQRKILIVVPVAFSTLASARGRSQATSAVSKAAAEMAMKVLYEVRGLDGVPAHRILEIVSLIKPYCMTVVGHVGADRRAIQAVRQCGFSGVCVTYDGAVRDQSALQDYLTDLSATAKAAAGACMVQGFDNLRQLAVARLAGVSHASVKASALQATGARA